jgi:hypothetical protein
LQTALLKARSRDDEKFPRGFTIDTPIIVVGDADSGAAALGPNR